jgi:hypothetical protein
MVAATVEATTCKTSIKNHVKTHTSVDFKNQHVRDSCCSVGIAPWSNLFRAKIWRFD